LSDALSPMMTRVRASAHAPVEVLTERRVSKICVHHRLAP
jgi:hypothetical protein